MRQKPQIQPNLYGPWPVHSFSRELAVMARVLDAHRVIAELAGQDLVGDRNPEIGAPGMEAMDVVKAAVLLPPQIPNPIHRARIRI